MPHALASLHEVLLYLHLSILSGEKGEGISLLCLGRNCGGGIGNASGEAQVSNPVLLEANPGRWAQSLLARPSAGAAVTPTGRGRGGCRLGQPLVALSEFPERHCFVAPGSLPWILAGHRGEAKPARVPALGQHQGPQPLGEGAPARQLGCRCSRSRGLASLGREGPAVWGVLAWGVQL